MRVLVNVETLRRAGVAAKNAESVWGARAVHTAAFGHGAALVGMIQIHGGITALEGTSGRDHVFRGKVQGFEEGRLRGARHVEVKTMARGFFIETLERGGASARVFLTGGKSGSRRG